MIYIPLPSFTSTISDLNFDSGFNNAPHNVLRSFGQYFDTELVLYNINC